MPDELEVSARNIFKLRVTESFKLVVCDSEISEILLYTASTLSDTQVCVALSLTTSRGRRTVTQKFRDKGWTHWIETCCPILC